MTRNGSHAVVLSASMARLAHVAELAERFDTVTLVDRDVPRGEQRTGVPQGHHPHLLMPRGVDGLDSGYQACKRTCPPWGGHVIGSPEVRFHVCGGRLTVRDRDI